MRRHLSPPDAFLESLAGEVGSTRLELDGDALVGVIHDVLFEFSFDPAAMSTVSLCVTRRYLVSARLRPLRSLDQFRLAVKNGATFRSSAELLGHLLREQAAVLVDIVRKVTGRVDGIEDKLLARFPETTITQRMSAVRLLGRVGTAKSVPVLEMARAEADAEMKLLIERALESIRKRK